METDSSLSGFYLCEMASNQGIQNSFVTSKIQMSYFLKNVNNMAFGGKHNLFKSNSVKYGYLMQRQW